GSGGGGGAGGGGGGFRPAPRVGGKARSPAARTTSKPLVAVLPWSPLRGAAARAAPRRSAFLLRLRCLPAGGPAPSARTVPDSPSRARAAARPSAGEEAPGHAPAPAPRIRQASRPSTPRSAATPRP